MARALLLLALCGLLAHASDILSIVPNTGSIKGGTVIAISGIGFARPGLSYTLSVYIGTDQCIVDYYHSSDTRILCTTPPGTASYRAVVTVAIIDAIGAEYSRCLITAAPTTTNPNPLPACTFTYRAANTPQLDRVTMSGTANSLIAFRGTLLGGSANSDANLVYDPRINSLVCLLDPSAVTTTNDYDNTCQVADQSAGRYSFALTTMQPSTSSLTGYGLAQQHPRMNQVSPDGKPFQFTQVPLVTSVWPSTGATSGGALITIQGSSFLAAEDANATQRITVLLSGRPCSVISTLLDQVVCRSGLYTGTADTTAIANVPVFGASRGLRLRKYMGLPSATVYSLKTNSNPLLTMVPTEDILFDDGLFVSESPDRLVLDYYAYLFTALFVPPATGTYQFIGKCDDQLELYLGTDANSATMTRVLMITDTSNSYWNSASKISSALQLVGGKQYYFQARFFELYGSDFASIALRRVNPGTLSEAQQRYQTIGLTQMVKIQNTIVREQQQLRITANAGGTFVLTVGSVSSAILTFPPSNSAMSTAIAAIQPCQYISVTQTGAAPTVTYTVTYNCPQPAGQPVRPRPQVYSVSLASDWAFAVNTTQASSVNVGGTFTLQHNGQVTDTLAVTATTSQVKAALEALSGINTVAVSTDGNNEGQTFTISFLSPLGPTSLITGANISALTGHSNPAPSIATTTLVAGSNDLFYDPIPSDFFQVITEDVTRVELLVDDIRAELDCDPTVIGLCTFEYDETLVPTVSDFSPVSVTADTSVTLTGTGLGDDASTLLVELVDQSSAERRGVCTVTNVASTTATCIMGAAPRGTYNVRVTRTNVGLATLSSSAAGTITYTLTVTDVSPLTLGSVEGGQLITVTGSGFKLTDTVTIGAAACVTKTVTADSISCYAPAADVGASLTQTVSIADVDGTTLDSSFDYIYSLATTPIIYSVTPQNVSRCTSTYLTIYGENFGDIAGRVTNANETDPWPVSVAIGDQSCRMLQGSNSSMLRCLLLRSEAKDEQREFVPVVRVDNIGYAQVQSAPSAVVDAAFHVFSISPQVGSIYGGTRITISGAGFKTAHHHVVRLTSAEHNYQNYYRFVICDIDMSVSSDREIQCVVRTSDIFRTYTGIDWSIAPQPFVFNLAVEMGFLSAMCVGGPATCQYNMTRTISPTVTSVTPASGVAGQTVTIHGTNLDGTAVVSIGEQPCTNVASANSESITCQVPDMPAGEWNVSVGIPAVGTAGPFPYSEDGLAVGDVTFAYELSMTSVTPTAGSRWGGTQLTITGTSFNTFCPEANVVMFHSPAAPLSVFSDTCVVTSVTSTRLTCTAPRFTTTSGWNMPLGAPLTVMLTVIHHAHNNSMLEMTNMTAMAAHAWDQSVAATGLGQSVNLNGTECPSCVFTYESTPDIPITITPTSGRAGTVVTIRGTGFERNGAADVAANGPRLEIGASLQTISFWNNTHIISTLGDIPGGVHPVHLTLGAYGMTRMASFTSRLNVTAVSYATTGFGGGIPLTISGYGFGAASEMAVSLCNVECTVTSSSYGSLTCVPNAIVTNKSLDEVSHQLPANMAANGCRHTYISSAAATTTAAKTLLPRLFDGDVSTATGFGSTSSTLNWAGLDFGQFQQLRLARIRFFPAFTQAATVNGGRFQGCNVNDGQTYTSCSWVTLATIARAHEAWNYIDLDAQFTMYRFIRYVPTWNYADQMAEIELIGWMTAKLDTKARCPISITVNTVCHTEYHDTPTIIASLVTNPTVTPSLSVAFNLTQTPVVTDVQPRYGSSLGGTLVTLTGRNFSPVLADNVVHFNSCPNPCTPVEVAADQTWLKCVTTGRDMSLTTFPAEQIRVTVLGDNVGAALVQTGVVFRFLDRWSEITTWADLEPPLEGDTVVIPANQAVLLDTTPPELFLLLVQGTLVFDRQDLALDASYILVLGGRMEIGTEDDPFLNKLTITLHGDRWNSIELPHVGCKMLAVTDSNFGAATAGAGHHMSMHAMPVDTPGRGSLEIHGAPRRRVWCKLDTTAYAGDTELLTAEEVDFMPGDVIIVTGSGDFMETEELTVVSLGNDKRTVTFTPPLVYTHESEWYTDVAGLETDLRVEVALLTRNIVIRGDNTSFSQQFGVHTMAAHGGTYRIENVELFHCGQQGNLGRYCTHFHMAGDQAHSYVRYNSIHNSFQRGTTVHGTNFATVKHNVAYHVHGHTFFVEDGGESHNVFEENLGGWTLRNPVLLASDMKPATFWTANPNNAWRHNVAFGGMFTGQWLELPGNPGGPSFTTSVCPVSEQLYEFLNVTSHSNRAMGMRVYPLYMPFLDPCNAQSGSKPQYFYNFTSFRNQGEGFFTKRCTDCHFINFKLVENGIFNLRWVSLEKYQPYYENNPHIDNLLLVGKRALASNEAPPTNRQLFMPRFEYFHVRDATFVNTAYALSGCAECDSAETSAQGGYTYRLEGLRFLNVTRRVRYEYPWKDIMWDLDGSLTGNAGGWALPYYKFNEVQSCTRKDATYDYGLVCDNTTVVRRVVFDSIMPTSIYWKDGFITDFENTTQTDTMIFRALEESGWVFPVVVNRWIKFGFVTQADLQRIRIRYSEPVYTKSTNNSEWLGLHLDYYDYRWKFATTYSALTNSPVLPVGDQASALPHHSVNFSSPLGFGVVDEIANNWEVMMAPQGLMFGHSDQLLVREGRNYDQTLYTAYGGQLNWANQGKPNAYQIEANAIECKPGACNLPPGLRLGKPTLWSNPNTWPDGKVPNGTVPVLINNTMWVVLDVNPPPLVKLEVNGMLEFLDNADRNLDVHLMSVTGVLQIGTGEMPFTHQATITLHGVRSSPTLVVNQGLFLGNKVLAIFGVANMYGSPRIKTWTKLAPGSTATPGQTSLTVVGAVDWAAGDRLVLTATEYETTETEILTVSGDVTFNAATNTSTVPLTAPLSYKHVSVVVQADNTNTRRVTLSAAVGLLSHNIRVRGAVDEATNPGYGASIVVSEMGTSAGTFRGSVNFDNVAFSNLGKYDTEHPGIRFFYGRVSGTPSYTNVISNSSFDRTYNAAIQGEAVLGLTVVNNVFFNMTSHGIFSDSRSRDAVVKRNLLTFTKRDETITLLQTMPRGAFFFESASAFVANGLDGNVVGGAFDIGYALPGEPCTQSWSMFGSNEVHAGRVGVFVMNYQSGDGFSPSQPSCLRVAGFLAWKNSHIGIVAVDQRSNLRLARITASDNHIAVAMQFLRFERDNHALVENSIIMGSTSASVCTASLTCRAVWSAKGEVGDPAGIKHDQLGCHSVFKGGIRRIGLVTTTYPNVGKTCPFSEWDPALCHPQILPWDPCSTSWEEYYGVWGSIFGVYTVRNTVFAHFADNDCGKVSRAVSINPDSPDFPPQITMSNITWASSVDHDARFFLGYLPGVTEEGGVCVDGNCDATMLATVVDTDGTTTGVPNSVVLSSNPGIAAYGSPRCVSEPGWAGMQCTNMKLHAMSFTNTEQELAGGGQHYAPIRVRNLASGGVYFSKGGTKDDCFPGMASPAMQKWVMEPNQEFEVNTTGSAPKSGRFFYENSNSSEFVVLRIFYTTPTLMEVYLNGAKMPNSQGTPPTPELARAGAASGMYSFDPQRRQLTLLIRGGGSGAYGSFPQIDIVSIPVIQVTLHIAMTIDQFYGADVVRNIALLLGISPSRIRTVDVQSGSVIFTLQIVPEDYASSSNSTGTGTGNSTVPPTNTGNQLDMYNLAQTLIQTLKNGSLTEAIKAEVTGATLFAPVQPCTSENCTASNATSDEPFLFTPSSASSGVLPGLGTTGSAVVLAAIGFVVVVFFAGVFLYCKKKYRPSSSGKVQPGMSDITSVEVVPLSPKHPGTITSDAYAHTPLSTATPAGLDDVPTALDLTLLHLPGPRSSSRRPSVSSQSGSPELRASTPLGPLTKVPPSRVATARACVVDADAPEPTELPPPSPIAEAFKPLTPVPVDKQYVTYAPTQVSLSVPVKHTAKSAAAADYTAKRVPTPTKSPSATPQRRPSINP